MENAKGFAREKSDAFGAAIASAPRSSPTPDCFCTPNLHPMIYVLAPITVTVTASTSAYGAH